ncbi:MAG: putative glycoside hydrolase, partial [Chloroflexia bacterium]
ATPPPPRSWPDTRTGIHVFQGALALRGNAAWTVFAAHHYAGARQLLRSEIDAIRQTDPDFLLLLDRWGIGLGYRAPDETCDPNGEYLRVIQGDQWVQEWPGEEALQPGWFFSHEGSRVYQCNEGWYLMEPDSEGWRAWQEAHFLDALQATDADGLLALRAEIPTWLGGGRWDPPLPADSPSFEEAWARRLERWFDWARGAFGERYRVIMDAGAWAVPRDTTDYQRAEGVWIQGFGADVLHRSGMDGWQLQMARILTLVNHDKIVILESQEVATAQDRLYSLGSYLLAKGKHTFLHLELSPEPEWWPEYTIPIGRYEGDVPHTLNELFDPAWGVYLRRYENGVVLVNPGPSPVAIYLGDRHYLAQPSGGGTVPEDGTIPSGWTVTYLPVTQVFVPSGGAAILLYRAP